MMQFARWGMSSAQPRFQSAAHVMGDAKDLVTYERDYRKDVADINHPDAALIANAPDDLAFLLAEIERLTGERDEAVAAIKDVGGPLCECGHEGDLYHYTHGTRHCTVRDCECTGLRWRTAP